MSAALAIAAEPVLPEQWRQRALIVARSYAHKTPPNVLVGDLEQAALMGLWRGLQLAADKALQPEQREFYLKRHIRGAVLDELRRQDWLPRGTRRAERAGQVELRVLHGQDAGEFAAATTDGRPWESALRDPAPALDELVARELEGGLAWALAEQCLPPRELRVLRQHYRGGRTFKQIANGLGISEPRISQLHARAIGRLRAALEEHEHRRTDRGPRSDSQEDPATGTHPRRVPGGGLGGPPATPAHRRVPAGAGGAVLRGAPREGLFGRSRAVSLAGAAPEPGDGGFSVTEPAAEAELDFSDVLAAIGPIAAPSVLPEEGINLFEALEGYRWWMIEQALIRTGGNQTAAGKLLGYANGGKALWLFLRGRANGRLPKHGSRTQPPKAPQTPASATASRPDDGATGRISITRVASQIDWELVDELRSAGLHDGRISQRLSGTMGVNRFIIEKALRLGSGASSP